MPIKLRAHFKTSCHSRESGNLRGKSDPRFREDDVLKWALRARGVTLFELILAILILAGFIPVILTLQAYLARPHVQSEMITRCTQLAGALMEEVQSKRFDELLEPADCAAPCWSSTLGPDAGELSRQYFDDVDDFNGFTENLTGDLAGFTRSVQVQYATTTSGPGPGPPLGRLFDWLSKSAFAVGATLTIEAYANCDAAGYKLITVTVTGPAGVSVALHGVATTANSQMTPEGSGAGTCEGLGTQVVDPIGGV